MADEAAGRDSGKAQRHRNEEEKNKSKLDVMDTFELVMMVWEETFERVNHFVDITAEATAIALDKAQQDHSAAKEALEKVQDHATVLPDGRRVYRDRDGNAYTEDGARLSAADTARIEWAEGSPSWECYQTASEASQKTRLTVEEIERYQERVQAAKARLNQAKPENFSQDGLERLESDLDRDTPAAVRKERERLMVERPEPEACAARGMHTDDDLALSRVNPISAAAPKVAIPIPSMN